MTSIEVTNEDVKKLNQLDRIELKLRGETIRNHYRNLSNEYSRWLIAGLILIGFLFIYVTSYDINDYGREHLNYNLITFLIGTIVFFALLYIYESRCQSGEKEWRMKNAEEYFEVVPKLKHEAK